MKKKAKRERIYLVNDDFNRRFRCGRNNDGWRWTGWDLIKRVEKWAEKYPKDVYIAGCDDTYHTTSNIVLVLHRTGRRLWGTTVYVLTQCDGLPPKEFFLYSGHAHDLERALRVIRRFEPYYRADRTPKVKAIWRNLVKGKFGRYFGAKVPLWKD